MHAKVITRCDHSFQRNPDQSIPLHKPHPPLILRHRIQHILLGSLHGYIVIKDVWPDCVTQHCISIESVQALFNRRRQPANQT